MSEALISSVAAEGFERLQRWGWTVDPSTAAAKIAALAALSDLPESEPVASVSYVSRGRLLVIAPLEAADSALATADTLRHDLDVHLLCPAALAAAEGFLAWEGKAQSLKGYLGAFEVTWCANGAETMPAAARVGQSAGTVVLASSGEAPVLCVQGKDLRSQPLAEERLQSLHRSVFHFRDFFRRRPRQGRCASVHG